MKKRGRRLLAWVYGGSAVFHAALAVAAYFLPKEHKVESVTIELADIKKKNEKPRPLPLPPPPPPPPPTEKPKPPPPPKEKAKVASEAPKEAPLPEPLGADGFAELEGVSLGNGVAGGAAQGAVEAPVAAATRAAGAAQTVPTTRKVQALAAAAAETCDEPIVRPKHRTQILPKMTHAAQVAEIEGVVRVEVTVDEEGRVIAAHVMSSLGYGLDEEALRAARGWTFHPATRCGRRIIGHTVIPFRFSLT